MGPEVRESIKKDFGEYEGFGFQEGEVIGVVGIRVKEPPGE